MIEVASIDPLATRIATVYNFKPFTRRNGREVPVVTKYNHNPTPWETEAENALASLRDRVCELLNIAPDVLATMRFDKDAITARRAIVYIARKTILGASYKAIGYALDIGQTSASSMYDMAFRGPNAKDVKRIIAMVSPELLSGDAPNLPVVRRAA